mgnify:FL=1
MYSLEKREWLGIPTYITVHEGQVWFDFFTAYYHINGVHNKVPCTLCGEMIGTKHMYTHMQRKHGINPPVKKFNCEFCGKGFAYKLELHDHRNTHTGEKPYLCKFCGKGFASFGTHRMHEKGHLGFKRKK